MTNLYRYILRKCESIREFKVGDKVDYPALTFVKGFVIKEKKYHEKSGMYTYHIQYFKHDILGGRGYSKIDMCGVPATELIKHRK